MFKQQSHLTPDSKQPTCCCNAQTTLPSDPDDPEHLPDKLVFSANSAHLAVCYNSGSVVVYELELPPSYYVAARPDNAAPAPAGPGAGKLTLVLHMTVATVKGERDSNGSQLMETRQYRCLVCGEQAMCWPCARTGLAVATGMPLQRFQGWASG